LRFQGTCYRAHDPRWSFTPLSGAGAAIHGGRFNPAGTAALYLSLDLITAIKEASQGFAFKIEPLVVCSYEVDCEDIADLSHEAGRDALGVTYAEMACNWFADLSEGRDPPSWRIARRLVAESRAGIVVPSFAAGATPADRNLVLWSWSDRLPHRIAVFDPSGRLPKNQLSWD